MRTILNLALLGIAVSGFLIGASGTGPGFSAPEVDPASAVSALALVVGTLVVIRGRHKTAATRS